VWGKQQPQKNKKKTTKKENKKKKRKKKEKETKNTGIGLARVATGNNWRSPETKYTIRRREIYECWSDSHTKRSAALLGKPIGGEKKREDAKKKRKGVGTTKGKNKNSIEGSSPQLQKESPKITRRSKAQLTTSKRQPESKQSLEYT